MSSLSRVFFSDNGSTAVEAALKMSFQYWRQRPGNSSGRNLFISIQNAYHGDTLGAVSLGGMDLFHRTYASLLFPALKAPSPYCYRCPLEKRYPECGLACAGEVETLLKEHAGRVAAVVVEPGMQAAAGMISLPRGYLEAIRQLCDRYGVHLIADEVATGFGRTGRMFACEHEGVTPDFLALAKGITGGYLPLAATLTTEEIYSGFLGEYQDLKTFFHGHSYTGNPIGCAAALANLEIFEKEKILEEIGAKTAYLARQLKSLYSIPSVGDIRQRGLMVGIELVRDRGSKSPFPWEEKVGIRVCQEARKSGVLLRPLGNVIVLMPPLSITRRELKRLVETVRQGIVSTIHTPPSSSGWSSS
jgi:adenosylmethionine-8-amino-7-oxononanoate transaminase